MSFVRSAARLGEVELRIIAAVSLVSLAATAWTAEPSDAQAVAQRLLATTVTVRISSPRAQAQAVGQTAPATTYNYLNRNTSNPQPEDAISLCSGVSLGKGLIVTFSNVPHDVRYRATLSDGQQSEAELRVADDYSGLRLLEVADQQLAGLAISTNATPVGSTVLTAAAGGLDRPIVSQGIVAGVDRSVAGADLPPLLMCDVRSTDTSTGAAIVDGQGRLIGIVAAVSNPGDRGGWTYAVPARHVARLVSARQDNERIVLRRQRPSVGLTLGSGPREGSVQVERVEQGGPAQRAGVQVGDLLLEAEGLKIRSAYQAVDLILKKQPGDTVELVVEQQGQSRPLNITLAGATNSAEAGGVSQSPVVVGSQLNVRAAQNQIEVRRSGNPVESLKLDPAAQNPYGGNRIARDETTLLRAQLSAFEAAIVKLQEEARQREEAQAQTQLTIKQLTTEVERLRKQLDAKGK